MAPLSAYVNNDSYVVNFPYKIRSFEISLVSKLGCHSSMLKLGNTIMFFLRWKAKSKKVFLHQVSISLWLFYDQWHWKTFDKVIANLTSLTLSLSLSLSLSKPKLLCLTMPTIEIVTTIDGQMWCYHLLSYICVCF